MSQPASQLEFDKLVAGRPNINLVHLMLEFAADAYPKVDRVGCLLAIDQLGVACGDCQAGCAAPDVRERLASISRVLYDIEGFHGNREDYYDPRNSYLNEVLERRTGIPISLGILYMAVAARAGLQMFGVNTPGHFVVGCADGERAWYVDPFHGGDVLDRDACRCRIEETLGQGGLVRDAHFCPASPLEISARVLGNLKSAYAMQQRWPAVLCVQKRLAAMLPQAPDEQRDLGLIYLRVGEPARALAVLEPYVTDCTSDQAEALRPSIQAARRMMAERN